MDNNESLKEKKEVIPSQITFYVNEQGSVQYTTNMTVLSSIGLTVVALIGMAKNGFNINKSEHKLKGDINE